MLKMTRSEKRDPEFQKAYQKALAEGHTETRALREARKATQAS